MKLPISPFSLFVLALAFTTLSVPESRGAEADERAAIKKEAEAFVEAFHKGDAKAIASFWTEDCDLVDEAGVMTKGRKAIEADFAELFSEQKGLTMRIDIASLRFITADSAIEDGVTTISAPDGGIPSRARYTNVLVKKDGRWMLASVREAVFAPPSQAQNLRALAWAIGEWTSQVPAPAPAAGAAQPAAAGEAPAQDVPVSHFTFEWTSDDNFILSSRVIEHKDILLGSGIQWIAFDASTRRIRSWNFESDGGFGEGAWEKDGQTWTVKTSSVLRSGGKVTATNIVTRIDADTTPAAAPTTAAATTPAAATAAALVQDWSPAWLQERRLPMPTRPPPRLPTSILPPRTSFPHRGSMSNP